MTIRPNLLPVQDLIVPKHVLLSVFDKNGLGDLVNSIRRVSPDAMFYSTGGTEKTVKEALGGLATNYVSVEQHTGAPEMEGGLVKTLHPAIHAGLLAERGNLDHAEFLRQQLPRMRGRPGVIFDVMVGGLYPFQQIAEQEGVSPEKARGYIDIGGPTMMMAGAKNWHSVAVLSSPDQYESFAEELASLGGTNLEYRFSLAKQAFRRVANYRAGIAGFFEGLRFEDVRPTLNIK